MGNINSIKNIKKINFEEMKTGINKNYIIINTLDENNQECLIENTISPQEEVRILNQYINKSRKVLACLKWKSAIL